MPGPRLPSAAVPGLLHRGPMGSRFIPPPRTGASSAIPCLRRSPAAGRGMFRRQRARPRRHDAADPEKHSPQRRAAFRGDFIPAAWQGSPGDGPPEAVRRSIAEQPSYGEKRIPLASPVPERAYAEQRQRGSRGANRTSAGSDARGGPIPTARAGESRPADQTRRCPDAVAWQFACGAVDGCLRRLVGIAAAG
jgi:hypothetical protein